MIWIDERRLNDYNERKFMVSNIIYHAIFSSVSNFLSQYFLLSRGGTIVPTAILVAV